jgi:hypothetical protein
MSGGRRLVLGLVVAALMAAPAGAQEAEEPLRPCRRADLLGHWQVIRFGLASGAPVDRADPAYQAHQRYVFHSNATMAYVATPMAPSADEERAFARAPAAVTWALDPGGRLRRQRAGAPGVETSECRVVLRALKDARSPVLALPGDVVLTDQDEERRPLARRLLRKLPAGE